MTLFVPHEYKMLNSFNQSFYSENEYRKYIDWYNHVTDAVFYSIDYMSEEYIIKGIIGKPKKVKSKLPIIVYLRGGSEDTGKITVQTLKDKFYFWIKQGYIVIASQYRGVDGGEGKDELGGADLVDVLNLFKLVEELSYADTNSIYLIGHSRGGMMALMALREQVPVKAAALTAPITDYFSFEKQRPDLNALLNNIIPNMPENKKVAYTRRSATCWADAISVPLIIMHGDADTTCDLSQSTLLVDALSKSKKIYEFVIYPGGNHSLTNFRHDINKQIYKWFITHS